MNEPHMLMFGALPTAVMLMLFIVTSRVSRLGDIVVECHSKAREQRLVKTDPSEIWELIEPLTSQLFDLLKEAYGWEHTAAMHKAYVESIRKVVEWDQQE